MAQKTEFQVFGTHAFPVVGDLDFFLSTLLDLNLNSCRSRIDCVLD